MTLDTKRLIMGALSFLSSASNNVVSYQETHRKRKAKKVSTIINTNNESYAAYQS